MFVTGINLVIIDAQKFIREGDHNGCHYGFSNRTLAFSLSSHRFLVKD